MPANTKAKIIIIRLFEKIPNRITTPPIIAPHNRSLTGHLDLIKFEVKYLPIIIPNQKNERVKLDNNFVELSEYSIK